MRSKVLSLEDETNHLKENLQSYKHRYDCLLSEFKEKETHIEVQDGKVRELQQKLSCKEQSILKLKDRIETEVEQKVSFSYKFFLFIILYHS